MTASGEEKNSLFFVVPVGSPTARNSQRGRDKDRERQSQREKERVRERDRDLKLVGFGRDKWGQM